MDTVGEFLTRIRNAVGAHHEKVDIPSSNMRREIATVLKDQGYIRDFRVVRDGRQGMMRVYLKYARNGKSVINRMERVSKPGRRYYIQATEVPKVRSGMGIAILSTNKGVMSGQDARQKNVGGEYLLRVW